MPICYRISNFEVATIINSTINNTSSGSSGGGGIYNNGGTLGLTKVTVSSNTVGSSGDRGGLYLSGSDSLTTIVNSTITNNTAISQYSSVKSSAGGISNFQGILNLRNTIVAGNTAGNSVDLRLSYPKNTVDR